MKVLIVDDSIDKISNLTEVISKLSLKCSIDNTETIANAILQIKEILYDIIIIDLHLPFRKGDIPNPNGGKQLLEEIYRKKESLNVPKYILGLSQYENGAEEFSTIWKVIKYEPSSSCWENAISHLFKHVAITQNRKEISDDKIMPTLILEGLTDLNYIKTSIELFSFENKDRLLLKSQQNAGANWVANQIVIWALQNYKDERQANIKSVGVLDSDEAGNLARKVINERLKSQNEQNSFKIVQILPKYNPELLNFYKVKCKIEMEIESLFPIEILKYAESKDWLEFRNNSFVENPNDWEQYNQTSSQYMLSKGIKEEQLLYTKKIKINKKLEFSNYVLNLPDKKHTFRNFELFITDLITLLELN